MHRPVDFNLGQVIKIKTFLTLRGFQRWLSTELVYTQDPLSPLLFEGFWVLSRLFCAPATPAKRKADSKKETPPAKKAKSESDESFCLFIGNLNSNKDFDEIKEALAAFFSKKNLEVQDVRLGASKKFGYGEFSSAEDMQTALELNGKKCMGQELKMDKARRKELPGGQERYIFITSAICIALTKSCCLKMEM
ncbi:nucleolin-like [Salvelinus fontinalis]|uniref:nucleolin-like n=1 Tax=Salvelinus fontinalis TaxID=8038 RepID=UPI002485D1A4|nr:nucleolin-like [Salvelinus fontinalis]